MVDWAYERSIELSPGGPYTESSPELAPVAARNPRPHWSGDVQVQDHAADALNQNL